MEILGQGCTLIGYVVAAKQLWYTRPLTAGRGSGNEMILLPVTVSDLVSNCWTGTVEWTIEFLCTADGTIF